LKFSYTGFKSIPFFRSAVHSSDAFLFQSEEDVKAEPQRQKKGKVIKFGWLEGVFVSFCTEIKFY